MSLNRAQNLSDVQPQSGKVVFMVGPEGGWTEKEEQQAFDAGFQSVTLGKRVLRTRNRLTCGHRRHADALGRFCISSGRLKIFSDGLFVSKSINETSRLE